LVASALALAVALLTAQAAAFDAHERAVQLVRWTARLLGAVAVAASVLLVIDGVLAV
jgi:methylase of polypeptide subunit release factors